jgi:hypothetical protein
VIRSGLKNPNLTDSSISRSDRSGSSARSGEKSVVIINVAAAATAANAARNIFEMASSRMLKNGRLPTSS